MTGQRKVWVRWVDRGKRWEVGHYWKGYKGAFRFYSWEINGRRYGFTKENKAIAEQFADHLRGLMLPDPMTGVVRYDPTKFSKVKRSRYALSKWSKLWIKDYEGKAKTKDVTPEYVEILRGYIDHHINPVLGVVSVYDIDSMEIKAFYHDLSDKGLSKKHVQNIMDCLKRMLKNASEDLQGLDMPKFPKYREKRVNKVHKTLSVDEQKYVLSFVEPHHLPISQVYLLYGLRMQEAINLKRSDFLKDHPALRVETLKGGPERMLYIDIQTAQLISGIVPNIAIKNLFYFNGKPYYRKTLYKIIRRALDKAGFKDVAPKDASRHSRASNMACQGASAFEIQQQLGHSDIRTSQIYTHVASSDKWVVVEGDAKITDKNPYRSR